MNVCTATPGPPTLLSKAQCTKASPTICGKQVEQQKYSERKLPVREKQEQVSSFLPTEDAAPDIISFMQVDQELS